MRAGALFPSLSFTPYPIPNNETAGIEYRTIRLVSLRLIPFLFVLYVACYLDRSNVSLAALQMNRDLGFSAAAYGLGAGIFFIGYALFEVPANLLLARFGARRWIGGIAIAWGILAAAMLLVRGPASFYAIRFLLGIAEAGFFPGVVYYFVQWFPEKHYGRAMSWFMLGIPLSVAIGGPLGGALLSHGGELGLTGWQWLFLLEGVPSFLLGFVALFYLTDRPEEAGWLPAAEREWLLNRLALDREPGAGGVREERVGKALLNPTLLWLSVPYTMALVGGYALALWVPSVVKDVLQVSDQRVGLVTGLVGLAGVAGMLLNAAHSDRTGERIVHAAVPLGIMALGFALGAMLRTPVVAVAGLGVAYFGYNAFLPAVWCVPRLLLRGVAAAAGIGMLNSIGNIGGFIGPYALGAVKTATGSFGGALVAMACTSAVAGCLLLTVRWSRALNVAGRLEPES